MSTTSWDERSKTLRTSCHEAGRGNLALNLPKHPDSSRFFVRGVSGHRQEDCFQRDATRPETQPDRQSEGHGSGNQIHRSHLREHGEQRVDEDEAKESEAEHLGDRVGTHKFQHAVGWCNSDASHRGKMNERTAGRPFDSR